MEMVMVLMNRLKNFWTDLRLSFSGLELSLLVFPVMVVTIVATTFLFPSGRCSAWQWWVAVMGTVPLCFMGTRSCRRGSIAVGCFLFLLGFVWILAHVTVAPTAYDTRAYHHPAIRMMIEGWNPVWQGTFEGIQEATGISRHEMRAYHVLAMPKGVWYFCAAASVSLARAVR